MFTFTKGDSMPKETFGTNPCYGGKRDVYRSLFHIKSKTSEFNNETSAVMPAKAGIHDCPISLLYRYVTASWIPASAGMTTVFFYGEIWRFLYLLTA